MAHDPFKLFEAWLKSAEKAKIPEHIAMALSTVSKSGQPSSRIVYLRGLRKGLLEFYTNTLSRKGHELSRNPKASLLFFWPGLGDLSVGKQVRIEGTIHPLSKKDSDEYFASRPRDSQIGAWASLQSQAMKSPDELMKRFKKYEKQFAGGPVPRPPHWGGYGLEPRLFEFWTGKESRLHDREVFILKSKKWLNQKLFP